MFLSASRQAYHNFPVELCLTANPDGWPTGNTFPVGKPYFPVGFRLTGIFLFLVVTSALQLGSGQNKNAFTSLPS